MSPLVPVPFIVQQRASDAAFMLRQEHSDRMSLEQNIRMEVLTMMAPARLGWSEVGAALALDAIIKIRSEIRGETD